MRLSPLSWSRPQRGAPGSVRVKLLLLVLAVSLGCAEPESSAEAQSAGGEIPADRAGVFQLGDEKFPFVVVRCDLSGNSSDGMLINGSETAPDGRRMSVEVERLVDEPNVSERATVFFGRAMDGDRWSVSRFKRPDGRWFTEEVGNETADGPLIQISRDELVVTAPFHHPRQNITREATLRARCPAR